MALEKFRAPALPVPPLQYDQRYLTDLVRALRLYFNQLDSLTPNQAQSYRADRFIGGTFEGDVEGGSFTGDSVDTTSLNAVFAALKIINAQNFQGGSFSGYNYMGNNFYGGYFYGDGRYLNTPYNQFTSDQDQTAAALDVAYALELNGDDFPDSISIQNSSEITFAIPGIYLVTYSIQFQNTASAVEHVDIWFRYKTNDIALSNSRFGIPNRKSALIPSELIAVTPFVVDILEANDYLKIMWHPSSLDVTIQHLPAESFSAGVNPAIPATPSAIVTVQFISAQYPPVERVAPLGVLGAGQVGDVEVSIA